MKILDLEHTPFHQLEYRSSGPGGVERRVVLPFHRAWIDAMPAGIQCLVAVSDIQGRELDRNGNRLLGEAVAEELALLQDLGEIPDVDVVLLAGDLFDYPDLHKLGGTGDVTAVWNAFAVTSPAVIGVHGNHDMVEDELAPNAIALDGQVREYAGLRIGGVSGIIGQEDRHHRRGEMTYRKVLQDTLAAKPQILLLHQGPDDPDRNQPGDPSVRDYLENHGSSLVIFGHKHWYQPLHDLGRNQLLNVDHRLVVMSVREP
ncbi:metallophosphoesterase [Marinobacter sp. M216]|uniref:Metallophosphoesterase n=1 Tax=Marinobacter albus TaxID=3030833 RepID=A0ABT7H6W0_9GAMM|nr:metallophosphoesterase [Marinobacter sp. M216]MDK9556098.1 metallophosphoesterase [Marinobacter sp. M216]